MDSNLNCCFNCAYFKILKHGGVHNLEEYKNLEAQCINIDAISEKEIRRRIINLRIFFHIESHYPKCRVNCKYFILG